MEEKEVLLIHYWQLPEDIFVSLEKEFHEKFCLVIKEKTNYDFKSCFQKVFRCTDYHSRRLFNQEIRFTIKELNELVEFSKIPKEEVENNVKTIGNHEDGTIIKNPKFPFHLKDLFYVASHLIFDGSFRFKKGNYFYAVENSLVEYHKKRLTIFGEVPTNYIENEEQLYFSYTIAYITAKILEINNFKSVECILSEKFKNLAKENKFLTDEIIKALIIDDGEVGEKIRTELSNQKLVEDLHKIFSTYYKLNKIWSRTRFIEFKGGKKKYNHIGTSWIFSFSTESFIELFNSISPLPINYKEENFIALVNIQNRKWYKRKPNETKELILKSLLEKPKSINELANELNVNQSTIRSHLKGAPTYSENLIKSGKVIKIGEKILKKGGFSKVEIFGMKNKEI